MEYTVNLLPYLGVMAFSKTGEWRCKNERVITFLSHYKKNKTAGLRLTNIK